MAATTTTTTTTLTIPPEAEDEYIRTRSMNVCQSKIGLPEVDRLLAEAEQITDDPVVNSTPITFPDDDGYKDTEDHISRLPDDLLQLIISLLTMREGAITSILSTRWTDLWSRSASRLNFNDSNVLGYKYPSNIGRKIEIHDSLRTKFIARVDHICQLRRASKMDTLQVSFPFYEDSAPHINKWIELAAAQGVTKVILDFSWHTFIIHHYGGLKKYEFPFGIFGSSLKYLDIDSCIIHFPPNFQGLESLVFLKLCSCILTDKDVQNIMSNCRSLEWLSLRECRFPDLTSLEFVGPSTQIKHLHISSDSDDIQKIKVQDMNILSLEVSVDEPKLSIKNVPHLARLLLNTYGPVKILGSLTRLETLFLQQEDGEMPKLSVFSNIKRLVFTDDSLRSNLHEVVSFLEACPLLQQLDLDMVFKGERLAGQNNAAIEELNSVPEGLSSKISSRCSHHSLKEVNIYGFDCHP